MTQRSAFVLRARPHKVDEYVEAHRNVCRRCSRHFSLRGFATTRSSGAGNEMFGYFEADDLERAAAYMAAQPVSASWQDAMAELLEERVPDEGPPRLEEIFRLD